MLPVFSVILEYRTNGRNSSDRRTVRHSRHFKANSNTFILEPYQLQLITEHAFRRAQILIHGDINNVFHGF